MATDTKQTNASEQITTRKTSSGTVEVFRGGNRITTGTSDFVAQRFPNALNLDNPPEGTTPTDAEAEAENKNKEMEDEANNILKDEDDGTDDISSSAKDSDETRNKIKDEIDKEDGATSATKEARAQWEAEMDRYEEQLARRRQEEVQAINQQFNQLEQQQREEQKEEKGETAAFLARAGGFLGPSASSTGVQLSLAKSHRLEMQNLEVKRADAIRTARNAIEDRQFELAQLKVNEAQDWRKQIENERQQFIDNQFKILNEEQAKEKEKQDALNAVEKQRAKAARDEVVAGLVAQGITDPGEILKRINFDESGERTGANMTLEQVNDALEVLTPKASEDDQFSFSRSETGKLLAAGFSGSEIQAMQDDLNTAGIDSVLEGVPDDQKAAVMRVLRGKRSGDGDGDGTQPINIPKIGQVADGVASRLMNGQKAEDPRLQAIIDAIEEDIQHPLLVTDTLATEFSGNRPFEDIKQPLTREEIAEKLSQSPEFKEYVMEQAGVSDLTFDDLLDMTGLTRSKLNDALNNSGLSIAEFALLDEVEQRRFSRLDNDNDGTSGEEFAEIGQ